MVVQAKEQSKRHSNGENEEPEAVEDVEDVEPFGRVWQVGHVCPCNIAGRPHDGGECGPNVFPTVRFESEGGCHPVEGQIDRQRHHRPEPGVSNAQGDHECPRGSDEQEDKVGEKGLEIPGQFILATQLVIMVVTLASCNQFTSGNKW